MSMKISTTNFFKITMALSPLAEIEEAQLGSILAGLSHAKTIGRFYFSAMAENRCVHIETAVDASELARELGRRGISGIEADMLNLEGTSEEKFLALPEKMISSSPQRGICRTRQPTNPSGPKLRLV